MYKKIRVLMTSDCILDKDIGLLKLIQFHYRNTDIWLPGILDDLELEIQQYLMSTRSNPNPLSVILKEKYWKDELDTLYEQFISTEYDRIVDLSCNTLLMNLVQTIGNGGDSSINLTILCNNQHEVEVVKSRIKQCSGINIVHDFDKDMTKYDSVYVKYVEDLEQFEPLDGKNLYISDHRLNMIDDESSAVAPGAIKYMEHNILNIYPLYDKDNIDEIVG